MPREQAARDCGAGRLVFIGEGQADAQQRDVPDPPGQYPAGGQLRGTGRDRRDARPYRYRRQLAVPIDMKLPENNGDGRVGVDGSLRRRAVQRPSAGLRPVKFAATDRVQLDEATASECSTQSS